MFESVQPAPPDAILGLSEAFKKDDNPDKINLGVGVYKDPTGVTPVLRCVKQAEQRILEAENSKGYKPIDGDPEYDAAVQELMFGTDSDLITSGRAVTLHTPGGTGALRVAGDYLNKHHGDAALWLSDPTWANHAGVFGAAGVPTQSYRYFDAEASALDFDGLLADLRDVPSGDVVLLHGCCHNPTGQDPTPEQWEQIAGVVAETGATPLIDFAYQGFAAGLEADAAGLRAMLAACDELIVCSSFSKNFGLYNERTGALTFVTADADAAQAVLSQVKKCVRTNYSNPPAHGGEIVRTILTDDTLRATWIEELTGMRDRINAMRRLLVAKLTEHGADEDYSFIERQNGMFSYSGLSKDQVDRLRDEYSIYIVGSGRINVAGITEDNVDHLAQAIAAVSR